MEFVTQEPSDSSVPSKDDRCYGLLDMIKEVMSQPPPCISALASLASKQSEASAFEVLSAVLRVRFVNEGERSELSPGQVLIQQGTPQRSMHLLISGNLVATKKVGGVDRQLGKVMPGAILGEISFLLGSTPVVSVSAMDTSTEPPVIATLSHEHLADNQDPNFFKALAANVARSLQNTSASMKNMLHGGSDPADSQGNELKARDGRSAHEIAQVFGVPVASAAEAARNLIASRECSMAIETGSLEAVAEAATVYLFMTHICFERKGILCLSRRETISLADVLGLVYVGQESEKGAVQNFELSLVGRSIQLTLAAQESRNFVIAVERARLRAVTDVSSAEGVASSDLPAPQALPAPGTMPEPIPADMMAQLSKQMIAKAKAAHSGSLKGVISENLMTPSQWTAILQAGAIVKRLRRDEIAVDPLKEAMHINGLMFVLEGSLRVEVDLPGRSQALVVGRNHGGDILGIASLLLETPPGARVVGDADGTTVIRLPRESMAFVFEELPTTASQFFYFLAQLQAQQLRSVTESLESSQPELVNSKAAQAAKAASPTSIHQIVRSEAIFAIFRKFVRAEAGEYDVLVSFLQDVQALLKEADPDALLTMVVTMAERYFASSSSSVFSFLPEGDETSVALASSLASIKAAARSSTPQALAALVLSSPSRTSTATVANKTLRHTFDAFMEKALEVLEKGCVTVGAPASEPLPMNPHIRATARTHP